MTIERIGATWPNPPDTRGVSPEYAQLMKDRLLPFDTEDPFIFHVLSTMGQHGEGSEELMGVMRDGGALLPQSMANERWGDKKSMIFARDRVAGDDQWLFMTPCNVFGGTHSERASYNPAVAFRLSTVLRHTEIAFRVHDLEPPYMKVERFSDDACLDEYFDDLDGEPPAFDSPDELEAWQEERLNECRAENVRDQLEAIADLGTQAGPEQAKALVMLYAEMLGSFRFRDNPFGRVPADDPQALYLRESAETLFPESVLELVQGEAREWVENLFIEGEADGLVEDWYELFTPHVAFPWALLHMPQLRRPELLAKGILPLCEAALFRDGQGGWLPVPKDVCDYGLRTIEKNGRV